MSQQEKGHICPPVDGSSGSPYNAELYLQTNAVQTSDPGSLRTELTSTARTKLQKQ